MTDGDRSVYTFLFGILVGLFLSFLLSIGLKERILTKSCFAYAKDIPACVANAFGETE